MADVKESRKERAARTRRRMIEAAHARFVSSGYGGTTMADIADEAGVAVQTLYFTFHTKNELLGEVFEHAVFGPDELPPQRQAWYRVALAAPSIDDALATWCNGVAAIVARVAPLRPVFDGAADDDVAELWQRGEQLRLEGYTEFFAAIAERFPVRPGAQLATVVDTALVVIGPQGHRGFVEDRGWTVEHWASHCAGLLRPFFD